MSWFWIALAAPALFALSNQIDKFLIHHRGESGAVNIASLTMYSSLIGVFFIPVLLVCGLNPFGDIQPFQIMIMLVNGFISMGSLWLYFIALEKDHASIVTPLFQMIPVFQLIMGYVFLHESLTATQLIGFFVILCGALLVVVETEGTGEKKVRIKKNIILIMLLSSLGYAANGILYKWVVVESSFFTVMFWEYVGVVLFGFACFFVSPLYRHETSRILNPRLWRMWSFNFFNEVITMLGSLASRFAALLVPVSLANVVGGFQPVFVVLYGWIFTVYFPKFITEDISRRHMLQKGIAIVIIISGGILINFHSLGF